MTILFSIYLKHSSESNRSLGLDLNFFEGDAIIAIRKLLLAFFLFPVLIKAQDTISLKMQGSFAAKILDVDTFVVRYKKFIDLYGPIYTTQKSSVAYIRYEHGERINIDSLFKLKQPANPWVNAGEDIPDYVPVAVSQSVSMYNKGYSDARVYFDSDCGAKGVGLTALFLGVGGLVPAIICSAVPPQVKNLKYPSEQLWSDKSYQKGYKKRARKTKLRKVWTGFGIGFGGSLVLYSVIRSMFINDTL